MQILCGPLLPDVLNHNITHITLKGWSHALGFRYRLKTHCSLDVWVFCIESRGQFVGFMLPSSAFRVTAACNWGGILKVTSFTLFTSKRLIVVPEW